MSKQTQSPLLVIFVTVFIYLAGFGMIIPLIPTLSREFGASEFVAGLLMSVFSLMQFLSAPLWGRVSDRIGRRPVLLFCLLGEGASYLLFAASRSIEVLFAARIMAGLFAGSISTASAYISDVTPPRERSKGMGLIGAAFGLGFVVGPLLGGVLLVWGQKISDQPYFGTSFVALAVAGICLLAFLFALAYLKESIDKTKQITKSTVSRIAVLFGYLRNPSIGPLIGVFLTASVAMSAMESTLIFLVSDRFAWGLEQINFGFAYIGIMSAFSQGFLVRRLLPKIGERRLLAGGLLVFAISLSGIALAPTVAWMAVVITMLALGQSFVNPSVLGSISLLSSSKEQGAVLGATHGSASLGRIIGPAVGGFLYGHVAMTSPYYAASALAIVALIGVLIIYPRLPATALSDVNLGVNELGFFQLDNLVKNHVPFVLLAIEADMSGLYAGAEAIQLERRIVKIKKKSMADLQLELAEIFKEKKIEAHTPIVLVCPWGDLSKKLAKHLETKGYINTYLVAGGAQRLLREKRDQE